MNILDQNFWNKYFEVYDVLNELLPYKYLVASLVQELEVKSGERILDAGAGTGNVSVPIAKLGGIPTGLDISSAGMRVFKRKLPDCDFVIGDLSSKLPFPNEAFDKIVSNNVIYAIEPKMREQLGSELFRVLKPGGKIVIANIAPGFRPVEIYLAHLREELSTRGLLKTLLKVVSFVIPTIQMFYYNRLISQQNRGGSYSFMSEIDQENFLKGAGFVDVSEGVRLYGGHGVLTSAKKIK